MINQLCEEIHENAKSKGFYDQPRNLGEMLALIHSEVSEALEADRKNKYYKGNIQLVLSFTFDEMFDSDFEAAIKNSFQDELADIVIRVMDLAAYKGVDLESHILAKMRYNEGRPFKHNKNY